ncbi:MAG: DNA polymerase I [Gemmatimonadetes bacterium]|nr:DNA polymerase I [Gemmatimonadota bacterium]
MAHHDPPQVFLVDGHALIYRAFFALISRPLRTSRGENTSAAWGVVNFLLRLQTKYHPDYVIWVLDRGRSFRTALYPDYKSTREKLDAELQQDFDLALEQIRDLLAAFRIPIVAIEGFEADDVIGTLARRESERGHQVVIVSGDKDFYQLIGPRVTLLNPGRGGAAGVEEQWVDESNAGERLGVPPRQVIDYLALVGDASDNVPGVRGIGEKTAAQLLQEYGDLESILAHAAEVKAKRPREALLAEPEQARLSRELVTIRTDVPVDIDLEASRAREPDRESLVRILARLEFHSLVGKLSVTEPPPVGGEVAAEAAAGGTESGAGPTIEVIDDPAALAGLVDRLRAARLVAVKTETGASEPREGALVGLGLAISATEAWYLPFGHRPLEGELAAPAPVVNLPPLADPACAPLAALLADPAVPKAGHNIKFDWQVLRRAGVELGGVAFDTMLASFVQDPGRRSHGLDTLSLDHLGKPLARYAEATGRSKTETPFAEIAVTDAAAACGTDTTTILALEAYLAPRLEETALTPLLADIEMPLVEVLVSMEWAGIAIDRTVFEQLSRELNADLVRLEGEIATAAGGVVNLNSPKQLAAVLFERLGLPVLKKTKTGPSTDADVLEQLAEQGHEVPRLLLEFRELQKLKSTYVDVLPLRVNRHTGRIHTSFNQTGAATGRLSSSDPNLQNIPVRSPRGEAIRRGFVPSPGWRFVVADYSQIELRLMAHLSDDPAFLAAFQQGEDIHRQTAAIIFGVPVEQVTAEMRGQAKTINFGTIYGQGPFALSRLLKIPLDEAKRFIAEYFKRFAGVRAYLDRQVELARSQGYVETLFKRRRYIPEIRDKNFNTRSFGERLSQNSPLQGSAADLIKIAMVRLHRALRTERLEARLLLQVHDELVLEAPLAEVDRVRDLVRLHMEGVAELKVPLVVDIGVGTNWLDAKR